MFITFTLHRVTLGRSNQGKWGTRAW